MLQAYSSTESGRLEVYVRSLPGRGGRWQVSSAGGVSPAWSPKGGNLFFTLTDNRVMVTSVASQGIRSCLGVHPCGRMRRWSLAPKGAIGSSPWRPMDSGSWC